MVSANGSLLRSNFVSLIMELRSLEIRNVRSCFLLAIFDRYHDRIVVGKVRAGRGWTYENMDLGRDLVKRTNLPFNFPGDIGRTRLGNAAQANNQQQEKRTSY